jgi:hypothetical protein
MFRRLATMTRLQATSTIQAALLHKARDSRGVRRNAQSEAERLGGYRFLNVKDQAVSGEGLRLAEKVSPAWSPPSIVWKDDLLGCVGNRAP